MDSVKKKTNYILFTIIMMGLIIIVGTYAWLSYRSNDTAMVLTIGEINNVQVTLSPYQIKTSLLPQVTYTSDNYTSVTAVNNSNSPRNIRLYYKINNIDSELISSDFKYTIERSTDGTTYSQYKTGNFSSATNNGELTILEESIPCNNTTYNYKVYLWIDGSNSGQSYMQGKSFSGELRAAIAENQYQLTIDPNGGTYNSSVNKSYVAQITDSYYGLAVPTKEGSTFDGWTLSGSGELVSGNASGDGKPVSSNGIIMTETIKTDADGSLYTNYKFTNASATANSWPHVEYPHYKYTLGHTYRIIFDIRLNVYDFSYNTMAIRHSFKANDFYSGLVQVSLNSSHVGKGWMHFTMDRTWDTATKTVASGGNTYEYDVDPLIEIYTTVSANTTASIDFDIKNIIINDITNETFISTDTFDGCIYKFGNDGATLTANWTVNN